MNYRDQLIGRKITVVGLGERKEMLPEIKFLAKLGAHVTLIDSRTKAEIAKALGKLAESGVAFFGCDASPAREDIRADIALLAPNTDPKDSWVEELVTNGAKVETVQTLLFSFIPPVTLVGVMGTCGKTTVSSLVQLMLEKSFGKAEEKTVYNISAEGESVLAMVKDIKKNNILISKIMPHHMSMFAERRIVPHVSVITAFECKKPAKADIEAANNLFLLLSLHTYNNFVVAGDDIVDMIKGRGVHVASKLLRTGITLIPADWKLHADHIHERENMALAYRTAELFKVTADVAREVAETYIGLDGRLQFVKEIKGVEFYNDAASTSPLSTLTALKALSTNRNVILIMGGMYGGEDMSPLLDQMFQYVSTIVLIPGSGTMRLHRKLLDVAHIPVLYAETIADAVMIARDNAGELSKVLFSPGFMAGGVERSDEARADAFKKAVTKLGVSATRKKSTITAAKSATTHRK